MEPRGCKTRHVDALTPSDFFQRCDFHAKFENFQHLPTKLLTIYGQSIQRSNIHRCLAPDAASMRGTAFNEMLKPRFLRVAKFSRFHAREWMHPVD
jgi:hypothetical protein